MNPETDIEIDPLTGKLKSIEVPKDAIVINSINRNLLYTKSEVDAKIAAGGGGGGTGNIVYQNGAPSTGVEGTLYINRSSPTDMYYFVSGGRFKITAVSDNPPASSGAPIGLLLALTYA